MLQFVCRKRGEARVSNRLLLRMDPSLTSAQSPPPSPSSPLLLLMPESLSSSLGLKLGDRVSAGPAALDGTHGLLDAESNLSVEAEGEEVLK